MEDLPSHIDEADLEMPYRILAKDDKFFPQRFKQMFGSKRHGATRYDTEADARKFILKQATNLVRASEQYLKKHGVVPHGFTEHEKKWLENIDSAPLVVEESPNWLQEKEDARIEEDRKHYQKFRFTPMQMKYIVVKSEDRNGRIHELPVMFPYVLVHREMKECVWRALMESEHRFIEVVGAGFCTVENNAVKCYGESESLGISSRGTLDTQAFDRCERSETSSIVER